MNIEYKLKTTVVLAFKELYNKTVSAEELSISFTRAEFEGNFTIVVFPLLKYSGQNPQETGDKLGEYIKSRIPEVSSYNIVKGFLNISIQNTWWVSFLKNNYDNAGYGKLEAKDETVVVEYCGPNTNKPLHLGHIRNMSLGYAMANIFAACGYTTYKVNIYNDRGIAICKSMVAWQIAGGDETPETTGIKGDHLVGKYYVEFDRIAKAEAKIFIEQSMDERQAIAQTPVMHEARECLRKWEEGDEETITLWRKMNGWVYEGFEKTYRTFGVNFDKEYFESETWTKGKEMVLEGLDKGVFFKKDDGSVWVDLSADGLDEKLLLRSDGTSVYITQDLGTAEYRYQDYHMKNSVYVVANEQDYHFQVLKLILQKLGRPYADGIHHLSYGMVDLPSGKMKSREGTVVDADDLIAEMIETAKEHTMRLGKIEDFTESEATELYRIIALGALKFFILRVDPKKRMIFNPQESIDFQGYTGPFVQYTYARIQSVLRKNEQSLSLEWTSYNPEKVEIALLVELYKFSAIVMEACQMHDPSSIANYAYNLAKTYNKFYTELSILGADSNEAKVFRLALSKMTGTVLKSAFGLLGIEVPQRM